VVLHPAAAAGFGGSADDYARFRPSYPPAALVHLGEVLGLIPGRTVVDLAAGTGKLTAGLVASGATVVAVEPVAAMRAELLGAAPGAYPLGGLAEALPLRRASVDAVTVAQAFHWFDGPAVLAELHRVLRAGGRLAVVYNQRDRSVPWIAAADAVIAPYRAAAPDQSDGRWRDAFAATPWFTTLGDWTAANPQRLTPAGVVARYRSISYVGALGGDLRAEVLAGVADVLATHPDTAGRTEIEVPQVCTVSLSHRR